MFALKGRCDLTTGKGGREEARGGRTGGERAEGGAESTVDGNTEGAGMGKEGQMPHGAVRLAGWKGLIVSVSVGVFANMIEDFALLIELIDLY